MFVCSRTSHRCLVYQFCQPPARLTNVAFAALIAPDAIYEAARGAIQRISNVEGVLFGSSEGDGVGDERAGETPRSGAREESDRGWGGRGKSTVDQKFA